MTILGARLCETHAAELVKTLRSMPETRHSHIVVLTEHQSLDTACLTAPDDRLGLPSVPQTGDGLAG
jgi:hypothetical protein